MSSKIDPFFDDVFRLLSHQGLSYRGVCAFLLAQGVEISPQALRSWFIRKLKNIAKRASGLAVSPSAVLDIAPGSTGQTSLFKAKEGGDAVSHRLGADSRKQAIGPLAEIIQEEEEKLITRSFDKGFLIRRKPPNNTC